MAEPEIPTFEEVLKAQVAVDKLTAEAVALAAEERAIKDRLRAIEARMSTLRDWRGMGELPRAERHLEKLKRLRDDAAAQTVRVAVRTRGEKQWTVCVIEQNGPKQARVRERYTDNQTYQLPSRTYTVHPEDRHHLRIYAEKSK